MIPFHHIMIFLYRIKINHLISSRSSSCISFIHIRQTTSEAHQSSDVSCITKALKDLRSDRSISQHKTLTGQLTLTKQSIHAARATTSILVHLSPPLTSLVATAPIRKHPVHPTRRRKRSRADGKAFSLIVHQACTYGLKQIIDCD